MNFWGELHLRRRPSASLTEIWIVAMTAFVRSCARHAVFDLRPNLAFVPKDEPWANAQAQFLPLPPSFLHRF